MAEYYDLDDQPTTMWHWAELMEQKHSSRQAAEDGKSSPEDDPTRVGSTQIGKFWVSTVWLGLNHQFMPDSPPLIYETMVFADENPGADLACERYSTREQAEAGHAAMVEEVKTWV